MSARALSSTAALLGAAALILSAGLTAKAADDRWTTLTRLGGMNAAESSSQDSTLAQASSVQTAQWSASRGAQSGSQVQKPRLLRRDPYGQSQPIAGGDGGNAAVAAQTVAPQMDPAGPKNVSPWKKLMALAGKVMLAATLLLTAAGLLAMIGKRLAASGFPPTVAHGLLLLNIARLVAMGAMAASAVAAAIGVALVAQGQLWGGLLMTLSGAMLTAAAYKAMSGDSKAGAQAKAKLKALSDQASDQQAQYAAPKLQTVDSSAGQPAQQPAQAPSDAPPASGSGQAAASPQPQAPLQSQPVPGSGQPAALPNAQSGLPSDPVGQPVDAPQPPAGPDTSYADAASAGKDASGRYVAYTDDQGNTLYKAIDGTRNLRNNNPGNLIYSDFSQNEGAIGKDAGGYAIFPDSGTGQQAMRDLLTGPSYNHLSLADAITKYAPPYDAAGNPINPTSLYIKTIAGQMGVSSGTTLSSLSSDQMDELVSHMSWFEGHTPPTIISGGR